MFLIKLLFTLAFSVASLMCFSQINLLEEVSKKAEGVIKKEVQLSEDDIKNGLIEALVKGSTYAVNLASADNGFINNSLIRIPFPDEAINIKVSLLKIGFNREVKEFENQMNKAAEIASKNSLSILIESIKKLSIDDAFTILNGEENSATMYLRDNIYEFLYSEFKPMIITAIEKSDLAKKWNPLVEKYNTIPFTKNLNPDLEDYITIKTIDGLFVLIAAQEKSIRTNPEERASDLLIKVFK